MDLTQGKCWRVILLFSLPVILSYLLQQVYSISDAAIVGQTLSAAEVAGVNDTNSLVFIFLQFAFGVSAGFCVITSRHAGAHDEAGVRRSLATQIVLSTVLTILLTALAMALLTGFLAYILYTKGLEGMPSSRASILASVEPVTSAVIGTIVFHEPLSLAAVCGIVLVLGGIAVLSVRLPGKKREKTGQI